MAEAREAETTAADGPGFGVSGALGALGALGLGRWLLGRRDYETGDGRQDDTLIRPGDGSGSGDSDT